VEVLRMVCCGVEWVGVERAHCCRRTGGCGHVFDDAALWDANCRDGRCTDPRVLNLIATRNGIWVRVLDFTS